MMGREFKQSEKVLTHPALGRINMVKQKIGERF